MALQEVSINDIVGEDYKYKSMAIPSTIHSYSICIEYLRKWFLSKFDAGLFGDNNENFYISGRHAFDDFRRVSVNELTQNQKLVKGKSKYNMSATLRCQVHLGNDRDKIDMYPYGMELFLRTHTTAEPPFFIDKKNHIRITQVFECMEMDATFNIQFETKAQQFDMYKYCQMRFRVGATQGEYIDYDQHVPYNLMKQIAIDAGFTISNGKIADIISFLKYLNMNSASPFLYKFRNINGKDEFFIRVKHVYVHIAIPDEIDNDDGELEGHMKTNFNLTFTAHVRFPVTKCYIYYSCKPHTQITLKENIENIACFTVIRMIDIPDYNEKGWRNILSTEWESDKITDRQEVIDLSQFIMTGDIGRIVKYTTSINLSPELFMDIKFFNNDKIVPFMIDWYTGRCVSVQPLESSRTTIAIYTDLDYVHQQTLILDDITNRGRL